jgi:hypothetical protein
MDRYTSRTNRKLTVCVTLELSLKPIETDYSPRVVSQNCGVGWWVKAPCGESAGILACMPYARSCRHGCLRSILL